MATKTPEKKSIIPELDEYTLPHHIKERANMIYNKMEISTHRGVRRTQLLYYCTFMAYKELEQVEDPARLASIMGLPKNKIGKSFSLFSEIQTKYKPSGNNLKIVDLIPGLCREIGIDDNGIDQCVDLGMEIVNNNIILEEEQPQKVAAAIIQYYMITKGADLDKITFSKIVGMSSSTIQQTFLKISAMHNV